MLFLSSIVSSVHIFCETADADAAAALNAFLAKLRQADARSTTAQCTRFLSFAAAAAAAAALTYKQWQQSSQRQIESCEQ
jgi:hypothetical protein